MSGLMDGISNAYALTAQINSLKASSSQDAENFEYTLQQNFNQMLTELISSIGNDDEEEEKNGSASYLTNDMLPLNYIQNNPLDLQGLMD